jgi:hypothetical protein
MDIEALGNEKTDSFLMGRVRQKIDFAKSELDYSIRAYERIEELLARICYKGVSMGKPTECRTNFR